MLLVGVDWAEAQHAVCLLRPDGGTAPATVRRLTVPHSAAGLRRLGDAIAAAEGNPTEVLDAYEATVHAHLTALERRALLPYTVAVPLFYAALDGFTEDPAGKLRARPPFLRLSEWLLQCPEATMG